MIFSATIIDGVKLIEVERRSDARGFFARAWCEHESAARNVAARMVQANIAYSQQRGTLRGLHYQEAPHSEDKLVRCTRGAAYVVALDIRRGSPTFGKHFGAELTADNYRMIFVPKGCAQGYQTLVDNTEMFYQMSQFYSPESARGVRYNDPAFAIEWPIDVQVISDNDRNLPDFAL